jgi:hypothetical protein
MVAPALLGLSATGMTVALRRGDGTGTRSPSGKTLDIRKTRGRVTGRPEGSTMSTTCPHRPACPEADEAGYEAARIVCAHPEQGWNLLCNGVVVFDDTGELLPDGGAVVPHRPAVNRSVRAA